MAIELNGATLVPRELTLREIELVLENLQHGTPHPIETEVPDMPVSGFAIAVSCFGRPVKPEDRPDVDTLLVDLADLTPSQAAQLAKDVVAVNPSMARRIEELGVLAEKFLVESRKTSSESLISEESSTTSGDPPAG